MTRWLMTCALIFAAGQSVSCRPVVEAHHPAANVGRSSSDTKRLELTIRPHLARAGGAIRATAFVQRHMDNRALTLAAICPDYLRRSTMQLDGAGAARKHTVVFESLPACTYDISATLHRRDGDDIIEVRIAKVTR